MGRAWARRGWGLGLLVLASALRPPWAAGAVLDDFERLTGWSAVASPGASVEIAHDSGRNGAGMRVDFDFRGSAGWITAKKQFAFPVPANFAFQFCLRGLAPPNDFEFKVVDPSGRNVWWRKQRDFAPPAEWQCVVVRKARLEFAWGPQGSGHPARVGALEFGLSAGSGGGKGSLWIDDLTFEEREPPSRYVRSATTRASTSMPGHEPKLILDDDPGTRWRSGALTDNQWVVIDLQEAREFGGLLVDWDADDWATSYQVQLSDDGEQWTTAYTSAMGNGGRDYVYTPDAAARYIRLQLEKSSRGQGYGIRGVTVKPFAFSASPTQFFQEMAADAPLGAYPKYFYSRQTHWTVVGVRGDDREALLNEEGMLEVDKGSFSIEPFLYERGTLVSWSGVECDQTLAEGYLPIPSVTWRNDRLTLTVTAFASGKAGASTLYASYRVENHAAESQHVSLFLAIRPFQVVPPWQSLNMTGGAATIHDIAFDGAVVRVNDETLVVPLTAPNGFGATTFEHGPLTEFLEHDKVPQQTEVSDPLGFASAALQYGLDLAPGTGQEVVIAVPFDGAPLPAPDAVGPALAETKEEWRRTLSHVEVTLPASAGRLVDSLRSTLAYVLINGDGAAIQPGSRSYARSWIRDGALTSSALLQMGFPETVRDFLRWYAAHQFPDGKIPCCVDRRGADPTPEHDSNGEFLYLVMEYYRFTHDVGLVSEMWPRVVHAVDYLAALRAQRTTEAFRTESKRAYYGLLPESISHEGYASRPVHSYWDDFFALRGLKDAAQMAVVVGDDEHAASFAALRDAFAQSLYASIAQTMTDHGIDYLPASVELGDFDPSSTAIALSPDGELPNLPVGPLRRTFDKYYEYFVSRRSGTLEWDNYTPYEFRNVDAMIRLGQRERAHEILDFLLRGQRPAAWNQWTEIVWRDASAPRFIGDMPHTWVGASFILAVRSCFVYEREADRALLVGAGVPREWVVGPGLVVKRLPTYYGVLSYALRAPDARSLVLRLSGDLSVPPGGIVVRPPLPGPLRAVRVNGRPLEAFAADEAVVREFPAEVVFEY